MLVLLLLKASIVRLKDIFGGGRDTHNLADTSSMLIMMYAYARISGDGTQIAKHVCRLVCLIPRMLITLQYDLATRWANYLFDNVSRMPSLGEQCVSFLEEPCQQLTISQDPGGRNGRSKWQLYKSGFEVHYRY